MVRLSLLRTGCPSFLFGLAYICGKIVIMTTPNIQNHLHLIKKWTTYSKASYP